MNFKKSFWLGIALWVGYVACRYWMIAAHPAGTYSEYIDQDIYITGFRLLLFWFIFDLARRTASLKELGFQKGPLFLPLVVGGLMLVIEMIRLYSPTPFRGSPVYFIVELAINLLIAVNEEISFRGFFYVCLKKMKGENWALYLSSAIFTLMHLGYQPLFGFPYLFISGLIFAKMRSMGVSLTTLIVIHWLADFITFIYPPFNNTFPMFLYTALNLIPLAVVYYWSWSQTKKPSPNGEGLLHS